MSWRTEVADAVAARSESAGGYVRVNCPACVERAGKFDRQRSLSVNTGNGWWLCHRCGWRGRLAGYDDDSDAWEDREPREAPEVEQPSDYQPVTRELGQLTLAPHRYLRSRGVEPRVVREARIGYAMRGDHAGAEEALRECVAVREAVMTPDSESLAFTRVRHARELVALGRYEEAEPSLLAAWEVLAAVPAAGRAARDCAATLSLLFSGSGRSDEAATWSARAAELADDS